MLKIEIFPHWGARDLLRRFLSPGPKTLSLHFVLFKNDNNLRKYGNVFLWSESENFFSAHDFRIPRSAIILVCVSVHKVEVEEDENKQQVASHPDTDIMLSSNSPPPR